MGSFLQSWKDVHKRVILFSGMFDPVHKGHIALATEAYKMFGGTIVFLPEKVPHHRSINHKHSPTDYEHRLHMLNIATAHIPEIQILDYPGEQHWIEETFTWLGDKFPDRKLAWLVGSDVAYMIPEWPNVEKMPSLGVEQIIVANRKDDNYQLPASNKIGGVQVTVMNSKYRYMESSFIRKDMLRRHTSLQDEVVDYITEHKLYESTDPK